MKCEIINAACPMIKNDCSNCKAAREELEKATREYLESSNAAIPNFEVKNGVSSEDGSGTIYSMWFGNPIAEIAGGHLKVAKHDL